MLSAFTSYDKKTQCGLSKKSAKKKQVAQTISDRNSFEQKWQRKFGAKPFCELCQFGLIKHIKGDKVIDPAHRHERDDYRLNKDLLWDFNQVILCCRSHHSYLDRTKDDRDYVFSLLRGEDKLFN